LAFTFSQAPKEFRKLAFKGIGGCCLGLRVGEIKVGKFPQVKGPPKGFQAFGLGKTLYYPPRLGGLQEVWKVKRRIKFPPFKGVPSLFLPRSPHFEGAWP